MVRVSPIKLQIGTKVLWFDPTDIDVHKGDHVIVSTERGTEYGTATADIMEVSDELVENLKSPLKPVLRIATEEDVARAEELAAQGDEALVVFKQMAAETNTDMHPVMVEFLFDGDKAVFYFEAEERVDFRELVRRLASHFHVRVDMRQIGVRDGARMVGGLGHCGQELCCVRMGGEFSPVTIRMAKEQNLSLNQEKISGCCGRLMCCLRYEFDTYKEVNSRAPKHGAKVAIPDGVARVTEVNVPLERVTLALEDGKTMRIPLAEMEIEGEGKRPNKVSEEVFEKYVNPDPFEMMESVNFEVASFTGNDKLANPEDRKSRNRRVQKEREKSQEATDSRKPRRRRRSRSKQSDDVQAKQPSQQSQQKKSNNRDSQSRQNNKQGSNNRAQRRPGQKSSGIRNAGNASSSQTRGQRPQAKQRTVTPAAHQPSGDNAHRKPRRRQHKAGGASHNGSTD